MNLQAQFGQIDIYLFDQLLKGRFSPGMRILDAGCGGGRNLVYFLRHEYEVYGVDRSEEAIATVRRLTRDLSPTVPEENFLVSEIERMPFPDARFDAVLSSATLHFATGEAHFKRMLDEMWRVLKPRGLFFARLASTIGIEERVQPVGDRRYLLPDGTTRFLVDAEFLAATTARLRGRWLEPLKTTNVQNQRCMTTWVLQAENSAR